MPRDPNTIPGSDLKNIKVKAKSHDKVKGVCGFEMGIHDMAYILKGLNCRIAAYEKMQVDGPPLDQDDHKSFEYTKMLREKIEQCRNDTLPG